MKRFRFDLDRCAGCHACVVACANENRLPPRGAWREVVSFNERRRPGLAAFHLSLACNHCERPACLEGCPAGVYMRDGETGAVLARAERCIGCRYCSWACPYDAPRFDAAARIMRKCDFCNARLRDGRNPACVTACPTGALDIEERGDSLHPFTPPGFPPSVLEPAISFSVPSRAAPQFAARPSGAAAAVHAQLPPPKITFRSEWPLLVFTTIASVLAAFVLARVPVAPLWFGLLGAVGLGVSTIHLGRPLRAWRAVWNWRHSWLSREIILFTAFAALAAAGLRVPALALVMLYAIDRLYQVALQMPRWDFHSAHTLLNAVYLAGILAGSLPVAVLAGAVKLGLYGRRKLDRRSRPWLSTARVLFGFVVPLAAPGLFGAAGAVLGDLIDRAEFYQDLEVVTPKRRMRRDFEHALRHG